MDKKDKTKIEEMDRLGAPSNQWLILRHLIEDFKTAMRLKYRNRPEEYAEFLINHKNEEVFDWVRAEALRLGISHKLPRHWR